MLSKTGTTLSEAMLWKANPRMPSAAMEDMKAASLWLIPNTWLATEMPPTWTHKTAVSHSSTDHGDMPVWSLNRLCILFQGFWLPQQCRWPGIRSCCQCRTGWTETGRSTWRWRTAVGWISCGCLQRNGIFFSQMCLLGIRPKKTWTVSSCTVTALSFVPLLILKLY